MKKSFEFPMLLGIQIHNTLDWIQHKKNRAQEVWHSDWSFNDTKLCNVPESGDAIAFKKG